MKRREAFKKTALALGVTASGSTLTSLLTACQEQDRNTWKPKFFNEEDVKIISAICDTILPKTDTPGALELNVDVFVDLMINDTLPDREKEHIKTTFDKFKSDCQSRFSKSFEKLDNGQKEELLTEMEKESNNFLPSVWGMTIGKQPPIDFYRRIKQFTLVGYYTSEYIGKNVLVYDPIPGEQKGCIPLSGVGNSWSL